MRVLLFNFVMVALELVMLNNSMLWTRFKLTTVAHWTTHLQYYHQS